MRSSTLATISPPGREVVEVSDAGERRLAFRACFGCGGLLGARRWRFRCCEPRAARSRSPRYAVSGGAASGRAASHARRKRRCSSVGSADRLCYQTGQQIVFSLAGRVASQTATRRGRNGRSSRAGLASAATWRNVGIEAQEIGQTLQAGAQLAEAAGTGRFGVVHLSAPSCPEQPAEIQGAQVAAREFRTDGTIRPAIHRRSRCSSHSSPSSTRSKSG